MLDQFQWPVAESNADEVILRNVREYGCHIAGILADDRGPEYAFSVGLFLNYGQAELVIFGLDGRSAATIINDVCDRAAAGRRFFAGDVCDDLLADHRLSFVEAPTETYRDYFGTALWFYRATPFPVLQMVWPDRAGRFPWESHYDISLKPHQPVLRSLS